MSATLFDKIWKTKEIFKRNDGVSLLWVDRHLVHEGSHHAFAKLEQRGLQVARPDLTFGVADHYVPTKGLPLNDSIARMIDTLAKNCETHNIRFFGPGDPRQGIVHVIGPEQGLTLPGLTVNCGDSHTSTHGACGSIAFGIGATEVAHVLATQAIWQTKPKSMRISVNGQLGPGIGAKDIALSWIAKLGANGARGHAIEYSGSAIESLSMEGRLTLCNLSIEGGGRFGMIAPDQVTCDYVKGRPFAPYGEAWEAALEDWAKLITDKGATFDRDISMDASDIAPIVTWGTSPQDAAPITATIPDPEKADSDQAHALRETLDYMGLVPGRPLEGTSIDQVFIGSCTNARIEDLRAAAAVLKGRRARVPGLVSPGSSLVKQQAEQEGLDRIFIQAGLDWVGSACSMCVGMNGDLVAAGKRCASTTNRNFKGRQGRGARTHLMSPAMVAAAAVTGALTDVRPMLAGREVA